MRSVGVQHARVCVIMHERVSDSLWTRTGDPGILPWWGSFARFRSLLLGATPGRVPRWAHAHPRHPTLTPTQGREIPGTLRRPAPRPRQTRQWRMAATGSRVNSGFEPNSRARRSELARRHRSPQGSNNMAYVLLDLARRSPPRQAQVPVPRKAGLCAEGDGPCLPRRRVPAMGTDVLRERPVFEP